MAEIDETGPLKAKIAALQIENESLQLALTEAIREQKIVTDLYLGLNKRMQPVYVRLIKAENELKMIHILQDGDKLEIIKKLSEEYIRVKEKLQFYIDFAMSIKEQCTDIDPTEQKDDTPNIWYTKAIDLLKT